jgi:hypothetical protein
MLIHRHNILHHLLRLQMTTLQRVVDGELRVTEASRRNRAMMIHDADGPGWFVKQGGERERGRRLDTEAACYKLAAAQPALRELMPEWLAYDEGNQILVVRLIDAAEPLNLFHLRTRTFPTSLGRTLGHGLATCHVEMGKGLRFGSSPLPLQRQLPWILRPGQLDRYGSVDQSPAQAKVVDLAQRLPELAAHLERLANGWQPNGVIHGDIKCDNCLVVGAAQRIALVDWEMADGGHLAWDVGGMIQSYLWHWISSMQVLPGMAMDEAVSTAALSIDEICCFLAAFWHAYQETLDLPPPSRRRFVELSMQYAGARMIQTAFEALDENAMLEARSVLLLQSAANLMASPAQAVEWLLEPA